MDEERVENTGVTEHISAEQKWQKAAAIATVLTLITSTFIGGYGVFLGRRALETATSFESLRVRPLFEYQYETWMAPGATISFINLGYGPGRLKNVTAYYENDAGQVIWMSYGDRSQGLRNDQALNMWRYLGAPMLNEGLETPVLVTWPWINSVYGAGESTNFLKIPPIASMPDDWRNQYESILKQAISSLRLCFDYESLDGFSVTAQGRCYNGPQSGDIVYLGGESFVVHNDASAQVQLTDVGYVAVSSE